MTPRSDISAWTPLKPHDQQRRLVRTSARFVGVDCGRGSGKTELAKRKLVLSLPLRKPWPNPMYFFAGPTEGQVVRVAWDHFRRLIPVGWIDREYVSEHRIVTIWGSELWLVGLDKPQRIEGVQWDGGVIDESSDIKPGAFGLSIVPALSHRNGWCWRIGVPKRQGIGAKEFRKFCEDAASGKIPNAERYSWPSGDILTPEQLADFKKVLDPKDYREQFEASWENAGGLVFYTFSREYNVRPCTYHADQPIIVGSDFNVDPMAWAIGHKYADRIEWFDEIWLRNTNTREALDVLHQRYQDHKGGFQFYGDAAGKARKTSATTSDYQQIMVDERFKKLGRTVHYPSGNPPVESRFASANAMICNAAGDRRMFVDPRCQHIIDDLESRHYKSGTRDVADKGDLGHMSDAVSYAVHRLFPLRVVPQGSASITISKGN